MERFEDMWHDLVGRIEAARDAPLTQDTQDALAWVQGQMDGVWNDHRDKKYVEQEATQ